MSLSNEELANEILQNKNILILTPALSITGGVANYYRTMAEVFPFNFRYFFVGDRQSKSGGFFFNFVRRIIQDFIGFVSILRNHEFDLIMINPSLNLKGIRDYAYYLIGRLMGYPVVVFFRGWDENCALYVFRYWTRVFFLPLRDASAFIVLSEQFYTSVKNLAPRVPVHIETTVFDESMLEHITPNYVAERAKEKRKLRVLFLSRVEFDKGVFDCIDAFIWLKEQGVIIEMNIAGSGRAACDVRERVASIGDSNLRYLGLVRGDKKIELLSSSDIMLFPSSHGEGMPNTVMEAMSCGMAVITTLVGGLRDFFADGDMGKILDGVSGEEIAKHILLFDDREYLAQVGIYNYNFSKCHFYSSVVANRIARILADSLRGNSDQQNWH